jgi:hypothetical protein
MRVAIALALPSVDRPGEVRFVFPVSGPWLEEALGRYGGHSRPGRASRKSGYVRYPPKAEVNSKLQRPRYGPCR